MKRKSRLGAFVRVRPLKSCNFSAFHGSYAARVPSILKEGLRPRVGDGVWLTTNKKHAARHAATRAALEGCSGAPIKVLRVHVKASKGSCPIFRPVTGGTIKVFVSPERIPADRIRGVENADPGAVAEGRASAAKQLEHRRKPQPMSCPPPITLGRGRR